MERILSGTVACEDTLQNFLRNVLGLTRRQISQAKFRSRGIRVNGVQRRVTEKVRPQDLVEVLLEEAQTQSSQLCPGEMELNILFEDDDILAVDKPAGVVVHPSHGHYQDSLANAVRGYFARKGEYVKVRPVGRLDKETSGIVIFAKNQTAAARLAEQKNTGDFQKRYLALAEGWIDPPEGTITIGISRDETTLMSMKTDPAGMRAVTHYKVLDKGKYGIEAEGRFSLVELVIETGRTHQIRVHLASLGHPLLGDQIYGHGAAAASGDAAAKTGPGDDAAKAESGGDGPAAKAGLNADRAALHAWECTFFQPFTGEQICLKAELPPLFRNCSIMCADCVRSKEEPAGM